MELEISPYKTNSYVPPQRTGDDLLDDMMELMAYRAWVAEQNRDRYKEHMMSNQGVQLLNPYIYADADMYWYDYSTL